jgi:hypothetical protein
MNRLRKWHDDGVIALEMSEPALSEALADADVVRSSTAREYTYCSTMATTKGEQNLLSQIEKCLFPRGACCQSERNDVEIVFNAWKYEAILVTNDGASRRQPGGILGNRDALRVIGAQVMSDNEAVVYVEKRIERRDRLARAQALNLRYELPSWVGTD